MKNLKHKGFGSKSRKDYGFDYEIGGPVTNGTYGPKN